MCGGGEVGLEVAPAAAVPTGARATLVGRLPLIDPKFGTDGLCLVLLTVRRLWALSTTALCLSASSGNGSAGTFISFWRIGSEISRFFSTSLSNFMFARTDIAAAFFFSSDCFWFFINDVILRSVGYPPPPPVFLLSTVGFVVTIDTGLVDGTGGAGFKGTDTSSRTADEVVASSTGWPICGRSTVCAYGGTVGAGLVGARDPASAVSLLAGCCSGLMLNPL